MPPGQMVRFDPDGLLTMRNRLGEITKRGLSPGEQHEHIGVARSAAIGASAFDRNNTQQRLSGRLVLRRIAVELGQPIEIFHKLAMVGQLHLYFVKRRHQGSSSKTGSAFAAQEETRNRRLNTLQ